MNLTRKPPLGQKVPVKSSALRNSARGEACTLRLPCCNGDPATTVLAHLRMFGAGGMSAKPSDLRAVYACAACHDALDRRNGSTSRLWGFEDVLRALMETHARMVARGLIEVKR